MKTRKLNDMNFININALRLKSVLIVSVMINVVLIFILLNSLKSNQINLYSKSFQHVIHRYLSYNLCHDNRNETDMFTIVKSLNEIRKFQAEYWSYISSIALYEKDDTSNRSHVDRASIDILIDMNK